MNPNPPDLIVVLGMHRSGTSIITGMLEKLGGSVGKTPMPAAPENPDGFWENEEVVLLNEAYLDKLRSCWADPHLLPENVWKDEISTKFRKKAEKLLKREYADHEMALVKDPRMCRVMPLWEPVFAGNYERINCVVASRPFPEVVLSLARRNEFSAYLGTLLWIQHVLLAERYSRPYSTFFTSFTKITTEPGTIAAALAEFASVTDQEKISAAAGMVKPQLRNKASDEKITWLHQNNPAFDIAAQLDEVLHTGNERPAIGAMEDAESKFRALLAQIPRDLRGTYETLSIPVRRKNTQLKQQLAELSGEFGKS